MKRRTKAPKSPELVKAHKEAWKALKAHPLDIEIEKLHEKLRELETWHLETEDFDEHTARYNAGKPEELHSKLRELKAKLNDTPESIQWFKLFQQVTA